MKNPPIGFIPLALMKTFNKFSKISNKSRKQKDKDNYIGEIGFFALVRDMVTTLSQGMNGTFKRINTEYSDSTEPVIFYLAGYKCIFLRDPVHILTLLKNRDKVDNANLPLAADRFKQALGLNLITVPLAGWKDMRDRTLPQLVGSQLNHYETIMRTIMQEEMLPYWHEHAKKGERLDLWNSMLRYSSKVVIMSFMGLKNEEIPDNVHRMLNEMFNQMRQFLLATFAFPLSVPTPTNVRFKSRMKIVRDFIRPFVNADRAKENTMFGSIIRAHTKRKDISYEEFMQHLKTMVRSGDLKDTEELRTLYDENKIFDVAKQVRTVLAKIKDVEFDRTLELVQVEMETFLCRGGEINQEIVLQEIISNLIAGSETTIVLMVFTIFFIANHPEVQKKLRKYLKYAKENNIPLDKQLTEGYLGNVINETLRMTPPGFSAFRVLFDDIECPDGTVLKKDYICWMSPYYTHHDPRLWKDPEKYIPERWENKPIDGSFIPFGMGPHGCPGNLYAKREAALSVSTLVENFEIEMFDISYELVIDVHITMRPHEHILLRLKELEKEAV